MFQSPVPHRSSVAVSMLQQLFWHALLLVLLVTVSQAQQVQLRGGDGRTSIARGRDLQTAKSAIVTYLQLILTPSGHIVATIRDNEVFYLRDLFLSGSTFSLKAVVSGTPGSMRFDHNGDVNFHTENNAPYAMCGNVGETYTACGELGVGSHTVTVTPFSAKDAGGTAGTPLTIRFIIVPGSVDEPVLVPAPAPAAGTTPRSCPVPKLVGDWEDSVEYPLPIGESQGGIIGDDLVVFSGFTDGYGQSTPACYARNLNDPSASWRRMDDLPMKEGLTHGAVVVVGLKAYLCGGFVGGHPGPHTDACYVYDHAQFPGLGRQWTSLPSLPEGRSGGGLCYSKALDALIYSGGAQRDDHYVDYRHTWMFVLGSSAGWIRKSDIPFLGNHMSYVSAVDKLGKERLYFLGGQMADDEGDGNIDDNYEYDPINDTWIERADMPLPRGHASSSTRAVSCGYIIIGGTTNGTGGTTDISYYDISTDTWTKVGELRQSVNTPVCDIDLVNGYLYCETGWVSSKYSARIKIDV